MSQIKNMRAADYVAERLYEAGCRFAFGMPGGEVLTIVDALEKAGIKFILCKHENNAGFMAEGVHHMTGAPGILVGTVGPGVLNGVNVVANAFQDRVPLIVLTGCLDAEEALTYTHQVLDHEAVFQEITKKTFRLNAKGADIIADKAVSIAMESRSGPVLIDVPITVADEMVALPKRRRAPLAPMVPASGNELQSAKASLAAAKRPVMIVGLDALKDEAGASILSFVEKHGVPFVTTYKAKGIVSEDHPLCLGGAGLSPLADKTLVPLVQSADLVICAGYDPIEMRPGWREIWDPESVTVIDISAEANLHYMHQASISIVGDVGKTLDLISDGVTQNSTWAGDEIALAKSDLETGFPTDEAWGPAAIIDECRKQLPAETIATADSGAHRILLSQMWNCSGARQLLQSSGLCTMGCAVPLAMGVKVSNPELPVVSFSGDGGMLMVAGELSTAAEIGANPIMVVFVDSSLALIELKQRQRQLKNAAVDFDQHDFAEIGRAFGGKGFTVTSREELAEALQQGLKSDCFTVIAAVIDRGSYDGRI